MGQTSDVDFKLEYEESHMHKNSHIAFAAITGFILSFRYSLAGVNTVEGYLGIKPCNVCNYFKRPEAAIGNKSREFNKNNYSESHRVSITKTLSPLYVLFVLYDSLFQAFFMQGK